MSARIYFGWRGGEHESLTKRERGIEEEKRRSEDKMTASSRGSRAAASVLSESFCPLEQELH